MAQFHRLVTPTYLGGLPVGYDYINDPAANGHMGKIPAPADDEKVGGDNEGTYFKAFGEDATSLFMNRSSKALAQNCDYLDDILRWPIPVLTEQTCVSGSPLTGAYLTGDIFVGKFGRANTQDERNQLVMLVETPSGDRTSVNGVPVVISLIHDGSSNNVLGLQANGFYTNPSVTFSVTIPPGGSRNIVYYKRSNLATLLKDGGYANIDGFCRNLLRGAERIIFSGGSAWLDSTTNTQAAVDYQLQKFITDLISTAAGTSGAHKLGSAAWSPVWVHPLFTMTAGAIQAHIEALADFASRMLLSTVVNSGTPSYSIVSTLRLKHVFIDSLSGTPGARTVVLPDTPANHKGWQWHLHDVTGNTDTYPVNLNRAPAATYKINGSAASTTLSGPFGGWIVTCDGVDFYVQQIPPRTGGLDWVNTWTANNTFGANIYLTNGYIQFDPANSAGPNGPGLWQPLRSGFGANDGADMILQAQGGQRQTGAIANNDGGHLILRSGPSGYDGSGGDGWVGEHRFQWRERGGGSGGWDYAERRILVPVQTMNFSVGVPVYPLKYGNMTDKNMVIVEVYYQIALESAGRYWSGHVDTIFKKSSGVVLGVAASIIWQKDNGGGAITPDLIANSPDGWQLELTPGFNATGARVVVWAVERLSENLYTT